MIPSTHPDLFSSIVLGKAVSPGVVTLSGHDRNANWDIAEAKDQTGASSKLNGAPIGQFQASFYLASPADQIAWPAFQRVLESTTNGESPKALSIYHPDLAANKFTEVCEASIGGIVRDERGGATVLVKFIEYRPPQPKASKAAKGGGAGGAGGKNSPTDPGGAESDYDPNAARKAELDALIDDLKGAP